MAKPSNPLGTSTGLGKGEAQVFGDTYSSFFKDKLAQAEKKDKELKDAMAKASDMSQLWSRDVAAFKPMVNEYQNFVRENARALIKGDFDATVKNQQMMNNLTQFASSSKEAQKFYNDSLKAMRDHPKMYYDKDEARLMDFGSSTHSGDFDYSKYGLRPKIDVGAINKRLQESVSKMGLNLEELEVKEINGEKVLVDKSTNKEVDLEPLINSAYSAAVVQGGREQADQFLNQEWRDNMISSLPSFLKEERKTKFAYKMKPYSDTASGQKAIDAAQRRYEMIYNIKFNTPEAKKELGNLVNRVNKTLGKSKIVSAEYLEAGQEKNINKPVIKFVTQNGDTQYFDPSDPDFDTSFNAFISTTGGQENLDDQDLSLIDFDSSKYGELKTVEGSLSETDLSSMSGKDFIEDFSALDFVNLGGNLKDDEIKSVLNKNITLITSSKKKEKEKGFSNIFTSALKGQSYNNKKIESVVAVSPALDSDYIKLKFEDGSESDEIKLSDENNKYSDLLKSVFRPSSSKTETKEEKTQLPESVIQNWLKKNKLTDTKDNRDKAIKAYEEYSKTKDQKTKQN